MGKLGRADVEAKVKLLWWRAATWGQVEQLAGVTDRRAFWKDKTEEQARAELSRLITERVERGEL